MSTKHRRTPLQMKEDRATIELSLTLLDIEPKFPTPIQIAAKLPTGTSVNYYLTSGTYHIAASSMEEGRGPEAFLEFVKDMIEPDRHKPFKLVARK